MTKTINQQIDEIVLRCFEQGVHWGTGVGNREDPEAFDPDYAPDNPIDRTEAVAALITLLDTFAEDVIGEDDYQRTGRNGTLQSDRNQLRQEQRSRKQQLLEVKEGT